MILSVNANLISIVKEKRDHRSRWDTEGVVGVHLTVPIGSPESTTFNCSITAKQLRKS